MPRSSVAAALLLAAACIPETGAILSKGLRADQWSRTKCGPGDIPTQWASSVSASTPVLPEYPRPQMMRGTTGPDSVSTPASPWSTLHGLWEWELLPGAIPSQPPTPGKSLNSTILVPFPAESCLSGQGAFNSVPPPDFRWMAYRLVFDDPVATGAGSGMPTRLLHFGAIDWQSTVYLNGQLIANHTGGFDGFEADVTSVLKTTDNELVVYVYDPSDEGAQPNGKQRISAVTSPSGDTYTPSSGIWGNVWLEAAPAYYIDDLRIRTSASAVQITVVPSAVPPTGKVNVVVFLGKNVVTSASGSTAAPLMINVPNPQTWSPENPTLYFANVTLTHPTTGAQDTVTTYFGLRTVSLTLAPTPAIPATGPQVGIDRPGGDMAGSPFSLPSADPNLCWAACNTTSGCKAWAYAIPKCDGFAQPTCWLKSSGFGYDKQSCRISGEQGIPAGTALRPTLNGNLTFWAGWLDQSWWPDGEYTAPTDEALAFDLEALATFGLNSARLHQKVNSERWYWHADRLGVVVMQDMIQKYGGASAATVPYFLDDLRAMIDGRGNHPSILQWEIFNEGDCVGVFNVSDVIAWAESYEGKTSPFAAWGASRLIDTNSGGPANNLGLGEVNDIHSYPYPGHPLPSATQYAMIGEFGGIGAFVPDHEWVPNKCDTYLPVNTPQDEADTYVTMASQLMAQRATLAVSIYTQITDVERECDGFLNMDRTSKFNANQTASIAAANLALTHGL